MKTNVVRTIWVVCCSAYFTAITCIAAIWKHMRQTSSRSWVDGAIQRWISHLLRVAKVHYKVINPHRVKPHAGTPTIIMCNHSSMYDIPISYKAFPDISMRMLAKKELSKIPLLGQGMRDAGFPFVDRKNRHQAMKDMAEARALMGDGIVLWICPEGTRSKTGKLASFKKGGFILAIEAGATIIPMGIRGAFNILPPKQIFAINTNQHAEIHIGKGIDASEYTLENKDALIQRTWEAIYDLTGEADVRKMGPAVDAAGVRQ